MTTTRTLTTGKPATPERWQLAARRARAEGITVRQVNDTGQWIATSGTRKDRAYTLEIVNGMVLSCSCEAAKFGDPCCKHRAAYYLNTGRIVLDEPTGEEQPERFAVIVTGSREYAKAQSVCDHLDRLNPNLVIQGGAAGADYLALMWARARGISYETFSANWEAFGRAAGPKRNEEMAIRGVDLREAGWRVLVLAFPGGKGTANMVRVAEATGSTWSACPNERQALFVHPHRRHRAHRPQPRPPATRGPDRCPGRVHEPRPQVPGDAQRQEGRHARRRQPDRGGRAQGAVFAADRMPQGGAVVIGTGPRCGVFTSRGTPCLRPAINGRPCVFHDPDRKPAPRSWPLPRRWKLMELIERGWDDERIGRRLGCSGAAVKLARRRYAIPAKGKTVLTARRVADMLGIGCAKSVVRWIKHGWLRAHRGWVQGENRTWIIRGEDLLAFLANPDHFHRWDPARITDAGLRAHAERHRRGVRFLTLSDVAARYYVQPGTVAQWIDKGWLPAVRNGNRLVRESDLAHFQLPQLGGSRKQSWAPCVRCGDPDGPIMKYCVTPARIRGDRFGVDGKLCRTCYTRLHNDARRVARASL